MKTRILLAIIASMLVGRADRADNKQQQVPVVVPVRGCGTVTTSKFGDGYITRTSDGRTYATSKFGGGTITRDSKGNTWTTSKFGSGAITRGPDGQTITTSKFGDGYISRDTKGGTTTTSKFGNGTISRSGGGGGGGSATTTPFGSSYITRGCPTAPAANKPTPGNVIVLPAKK
jgi:hypothetical protein